MTCGAFEHRNGLVEGFTKQYRCHRLVHYESFDVGKAIDREKQLRRWNRTKNGKTWLSNGFRGTCISRKRSSLYSPVDALRASTDSVGLTEWLCDRGGT